jgi:phage baseplate assembly protein V
MNNLLMERAPGRGGGIYDPDMADQVRRGANLLRAGTVSAVDYVKARVRVNIGKISTAWLPWLTHRAGPDTTWWAPEIGEQVMVLAPCGDLGQAVVVGSIYQNSFPAPAASADVTVTKWKDGTTVTYDRAAHKLTVNCAGEVDIIAAARVTVKAPSIALIGNVSVQGSITASGAITDTTGNTNHHTHG